MTEHDTKTLQASLADKLDADLAAMKGAAMQNAYPQSNTVTTERPNGAASVSDQMIGVAQTIKGIHRDLDALQAEFGKQLDAIRKRMGGKG